MRRFIIAILVAVLLIGVVAGVVKAGIMQVGSDPIDRSGSTGSALFTWLNLQSPAVASGNITEVKVYMNSTATGCYVGTFCLVSGTTYNCRDAESIGSLSVGLNTKTVNLTTVTGDYIGIYFGATATGMDRGSGTPYIRRPSGVGNKCVASTQTNFSATEVGPASVCGIAKISPPSGVTGFSGTQTDEGEITLSWTHSESSAGVRVLVGYEGYYTDKDAAPYIYQGVGTSLYAWPGAPVDVADKYFSIWEYNGIGWSGPSYFFFRGGRDG